MIGAQRRRGDEWRWGQAVPRIRVSRCLATALLDQPTALSLTVASAHASVSAANAPRRGQAVLRVATFVLPPARLRLTGSQQLAGYVYPMVHERGSTT